MAKKYNVAVVGATGMVGTKMFEILMERNFPVDKVKLLASSRSAGLKVQAGDAEVVVEELTPQAFNGVDFAFFSAGGDISRKYAPEAVKRGAVVVDNSSAFRMDENVPLVVPEVNPQDVHKHTGIIANPNCSTIQVVVALQPIEKAAEIKRVVASTYQSVSGAGKEAVDELLAQSRAYLAGEEVKTGRIPYAGADKTYQLAFNLVPQLDIFEEDGYCREEKKVIYETRKIMNLPELPVTATTVRVPVVNSHSVSLNVELKNELSAEDARLLLEKAPGVIVVDEPTQLFYPMPTISDGKDEVFVGRIRQDYSVKNGLNLWVVADNIRKGAATNSIQIAELLL